MLHTVVETPSFIRNCEALKLNPKEIKEIISLLAHNPDSGAVISGTGGVRKIRLPSRDKGKSGGYRVITVYSGKDIPVFLINIYSKKIKDNLSKQERNHMKILVKELVREYRK